jgi:hypothetical protein
MIRKVKAILLCSAIVLTTALAPTQVTYADTDIRPVSCSDTGERNFLSFPTWDSNLTCEQDYNAKNPKGTRHVVVTDLSKFIWTVVLNVLDILLRIAGILAVIMLIVSAYQYLTSTGVPDKITKAKTGMIRAIVGLALALLASTIIYFVVGRLMTP